VLPLPGPPEDRSFRPDVEGLRAIAVSLVVLFHARFVPVSGGYIGVDVFFVVSGFLITGLLLRERLSTGATSLSRFYARRARRILPAATLVLMTTVVASYQFLGFLRANAVALDARWTAFFAANLHFALQDTQYLNALDPPSPLQHYWTLAVEEQFYLVWPLLFLIVASLKVGASIRVRLAIVLIVIVIAAFAWSVIETGQDANWAFFSPLTRAWELASGAALAVAVPALLRLPRAIGPWLGWFGLLVIVSSAFLLTESSRFPGYLAALPALGTAFAVAGGTVAPGSGAEVILSRAPLQWLGQRSYSLYLWHWPILIIAAQATSTILSPLQNLTLVAVAIGLAAATFRLVENPIRHSKSLAKRPALTLGLAMILILAAYGVGSFETQLHHSRAPAADLGKGQIRVVAPRELLRTSRETVNDELVDGAYREPTSSGRDHGTKFTAVAVISA
jgi:peptidoglycan/LPS O-acetylase OafA/YrhL